VGFPYHKKETVILPVRFPYHRKEQGIPLFRHAYRKHETGKIAAGSGLPLPMRQGRWWRMGVGNTYKDMKRQSIFIKINIHE